MATLIPQGGVFSGIDRLNESLGWLAQMQENKRRNALVEGIATEDRNRQLQEIQRQEMVRNAMSQPYTQQTGGPLMSQAGQDYQPVSLETIQPTRELVGQRLMGLGEWEQSLKYMPEQSQPEFQIIDGQYVPKQPGQAAMPIPGFTPKEKESHGQSPFDVQEFLLFKGFHDPASMEAKTFFGSPQGNKEYLDFVDRKAAARYNPAPVNVQFAGFDTDGNPVGWNSRTATLVTPNSDKPVTGPLTPKTVGPQTPEAAAKTQMIEQGQREIAKFKEMLFPDGPGGAMNKGLLLSMQARVPYTEGRTAYTLVYDAIESKLRAESGAAVPDTEVKRMAKRLVPSALDNDSTIKNKLAQLDAFLGGTIDKINEKRNPKAGGKEAPSEAVAYLRQNPKLKEAFRSKYGYLPEGM